jgi:hypothetical protein
MLQGLSLLLMAFRYAKDLQCSVWNFGIEIKTLQAVGLTNSDFRWLINKGYAQHGTELTAGEVDQRRFRRGKDQKLTRKSCFVLTEAGAFFAAQACAGHPQSNRSANGDVLSKGGSPDLRGPRWDGGRRELWLGSHLIKQFRQPAPSQERILEAFEEEDWPLFIDDPLSPEPGLDSKGRLHETIHNMNRHQKHRLIRFFGDGSGERVCWEPISQPNPALPLELPQSYSCERWRSVVMTGG